MKKLYCTLYLLIFTITTLFAQQMKIREFGTWGIYDYWEFVHDMTTDKGGNVLQVGITRGLPDMDIKDSTGIFAQSTNTHSVPYLVKYDSLLNFQWAKTPISASISFEKVLTTTNDNIIVVGRYEGSPSVNLTLNASAILLSNTPAGYFIVKYDKDGNFITKNELITFKDSLHQPFFADGNLLHDFNIDHNGNIWIAGYTDTWIQEVGNNSHQAPEFSYFIAKLDSNLQVNWIKHYSLQYRTYNFNEISVGGGTIHVVPDNTDKIWVGLSFRDTLNISFDGTEYLYPKMENNDVSMPLFNYNIDAFIAQYTTDGELLNYRYYASEQDSVSVQRIVDLNITKENKLLAAIAYSHEIRLTDNNYINLNSISEQVLGRNIALVQYEENLNTINFQKNLQSTISGLGSSSKEIQLDDCGNLYLNFSDVVYNSYPTDEFADSSKKIVHDYGVYIYDREFNYLDELLNGIKYQGSIYGFYDLRFTPSAPYIHVSNTYYDNIAIQLADTASIINQPNYNSSNTHVDAYIATIQVPYCNRPIAPPLPLPTIPAVYSLPNIFTPNKDGKNDFLQAITNQAIKQLELTIYNRWGNKMYTTTNPAFQWDGYSNGEPCSDGVYFYVGNYQDMQNTTFPLKGSIQLINE